MIALVLLAGVLWVALIFSLIDADRQKERFWSMARRCDYYREEAFRLKAQLERLQQSDNVIPIRGSK